MFYSQVSVQHCQHLYTYSPVINICVLHGDRFIAAGAVRKNITLARNYCKIIKAKEGIL